MSKRQQRAAKRARIQRHVQQPVPLPPVPPPPPRVFPKVKIPFYLPELFGQPISCWQGVVPGPGEPVPVIRRRDPS